MAAQPASTSPSSRQRENLRADHHALTDILARPENNYQLTTLWSPHHSRHVYSKTCLLALRHTRRHPFPPSDPIAKPTSLPLQPFSFPSPKIQSPQTSDIQLPPAEAGLSFSALSLPTFLLKALQNQNLTHPSPIQAAALPPARLGLDLIAQAKSGTGKTLVFALTALEVFQTLPATPAALILAPTRELAAQIRSVIARLSVHMHPVPTVVSLVGGVPERDDVRTLAGGPGVVVGTPGRVFALLKSGVLDPTGVRLLVMDEADRLLDGAFGEALPSICALLPGRMQCLAFSATFPDSLERLLEKVMRHPRRVSACGEDRVDDQADAMRKAVLIGVQQQKVDLGAQQSDDRIVLRMKVEAVTKFLEETPFSFCIVFLNNKEYGRKVALQLRKAGFRSSNINANISQRERVSVMEAVNKGDVQVLTSTDLLARGVDIEACDLVLHLDVPSDPATYLHRVGRAGRFGKLGVSVVFFSGPEEAARIDGLERMLGFSMKSLNAFPDLPGNVRDVAANEDDGSSNGQDPVNVPATMDIVEEEKQLEANNADKLDIYDCDDAEHRFGSDGNGSLDMVHLDHILQKPGQCNSMDSSLPGKRNIGAINTDAKVLKALKNRALEELNAKPYEPDYTEFGNEEERKRTMHVERDIAGLSTVTEPGDRSKQPWRYLKVRAPATEAEPRRGFEGDEAWEAYAEKAYNQGYKEAYECSYRMAKELSRRLGWGEG